MRFLWQLSLAALAVTAHPRRPVPREYDTHNYYAIEHNPRTGASIDDVAARLGVEIVEPLGELEDLWVVRTPKLGDLEARGLDPVLNAYQSLERDVASADSELASRSDEEHEFSKRLYESIAYLERQELEQREARAPPPVRPPPKSAAIATQYGIQDPYFPQQWHLANDEYPEHMMNVSGLWAEGITGKGVLSGLIDDGLDYTSEDLALNFVSGPSTCRMLLMNTLGCEKFLRLQRPRTPSDSEKRTRPSWYPLRRSDRSNQEQGLRNRYRPRLQSLRHSHPRGAYHDGRRGRSPQLWLPGRLALQLQLGTSRRRDKNAGSVVHHQQGRAEWNQQGPRGQGLRLRLRQREWCAQGGPV